MSRALVGGGVSRVLVASLLTVALLSGCQDVAILSGRIRGAQDLLTEAEGNGAEHCAPRELATGRAHLEFAEIELAQGDLRRAQEHFAIAEPNARAALTLTDAERCVARDAPPPAPGDRDGDGILDPVDECPDDPEDIDGWEDQDGCPDDQDSDGDGLPDSRDQCPLEPEDQDGSLDSDGCPDPDDDLDGILDEADRCRADPEDRDGFDDEDGCPDFDNDGDDIPDATDRCPNEMGIAEEQGCPRVYQDVEITSEGIVIHQQVFFETNRAVIRSVSFPILDTVAQVMRDFPDISIEVQGHTDSRGRDAHNLRLSQERADSVREYLVRAGIAPERLTARGYGETTPIESNSTAEGRAANRRVEFRRTDARAAPAR